MVYEGPEFDSLLSARLFHLILKFEGQYAKVGK